MTELTRLVKAAQRGDRLAFGELYGRYARMVHGILLSRARPADVDDLVQDVFITAMQRLGSLREPEAFGGWLKTMARHRAADHIRRSPQTFELTDAVAESTAATTPDRAEALAALEAIRSLPDAYRETLVLRLVEGMTGPEIAERTGLTHASVRVNLHRGMQMLRERLKSPYERGLSLGSNRRAGS